MRNLRLVRQSQAIRQTVSSVVWGLGPRQRSAIQYQRLAGTDSISENWANYEAARWALWHCHIVRNAAGAAGDCRCTAGSRIDGFEPRGMQSHSRRAPDGGCAPISHTQQGPCGGRASGLCRLLFDFVGTGCGREERSLGFGAL